MPHFIYKAKKGPQEIVQGELDAENEEAALGKISSLGLIPVKLEASEGRISSSKTETAPHQPADETVLSASEKSRARISHRELNIFTRQFAILLKASVPLLKIFDVMKMQTRNLKFQRILHSMQQALREGGSLSDVMAQYPRIFSQMYMNMIHSGEVSGTLDQVLIRLAEFVDKEAEIRSRVRSALIYPAFLFLMGVLTVFILLTFVMPRLIGLFADLGTQLPLVTRILIRISRFLERHWIWLAGGTGAVTLLLRSRGLSPAQKKAIDRVAMGLPGIGNVIEKAEIAKFLRSLELLYENGIPLYKAVEVATKTVTNEVIREELAKVPGRLEGGSTLAKSLQEVPYVSNFVTNMVQVGEESGQLGTAVRETAAFYEQETNQVIKLATALLEPLMILIVGVIVGFIVIAMMLPIFEIHVLAQ